MQNCIIFQYYPKGLLNLSRNKWVQDSFVFLKYLGYIVQSQHRAYITLRIFRLHMLCNLTFHQYLCICTYILTYFSCNYHLRVRWKFPLPFWHPLVKPGGGGGATVAPPGSRWWAAMTCMGCDLWIAPCFSHNYRVSHIEMSVFKWFWRVEGSIILLIFL